MSGQSVHWYDGLFFWPHHMQTAERLLFHQMGQGQRWNLHHNWGLRAADVDLEALANGRFVVRSLQARLPDGTLVAVPDDGSIPPLDLKATLAKNASVRILLAIPRLRLGQVNAAANNGVPAEPADAPPPPAARFQIDEVELEDENNPDNAQQIQVRWLNLKLLTSVESQAGFEVLPIAQVKRADTPEARPELDRNYIPPLLACDAWRMLQADILQVSFDRIGKKLEKLAAEMVTRGISFDTRHYGAPKRVAQLQVLNEAAAVLTNLAFVAGVHPLWAFVELCRIVGKLAIFGPTRQLPPLPPYNHDDLGGCFWRIKVHLDDLLDQVAEPMYQEQPFVGEQLRMQVLLKPEWLQPVWQMFVGVRSPLDTEEIVRMLRRRGPLDMKIGSANRVDDIFDRGEAGLEFTHITKLPQALPAEPGLTYFQIVRETQLDEWSNVEKSKTLAIRLNQNRIVGDIQGKRTLTIQSGRQTTEMQFTLYLVAEEQE
jgi:type VI secretion system protein ImpJ